MKPFKLSVDIDCIYTRPDVEINEIVETSTKHIKVYNFRIIETEDDIKQIEQQFVNKCYEAESQVQFVKSNWTFLNGIGAHIQYLPIRTATVTRC